jgi:hypothetical protein
MMKFAFIGLDTMGRPWPSDCGRRVDVIGMDVDARRATGRRCHGADPAGIGQAGSS